MSSYLQKKPTYHICSRRAERNSCRSRTLANIRVACAHVNKPCDSIECQYENMQRVYMIGTIVENCPEKFGICWGTEGDQRNMTTLNEEIIDDIVQTSVLYHLWGNGLEVPCRYRFVAKRRLIKKLEGLLQNQVTTSYIPYKTGFLLITRSLINATLD